jgi:hypothetical protein
VPTPFYHLSLAEELVYHPRMPEPISQFLQTYRSEFLFGSTAPDVQVVSGQMREETHFFDLPIQTGDPPAWEACLTKYPYLAASVRRETAHAAFLAGYLCHLQADWIWVNDIFTPTFGNHAAWGTFRQRLYYHNVLRAYLDLRTLPELPIDTRARLDQVESDDWLPFVKDESLMEWRDLLAQQLLPGAAIQTVEVFSSRQGISAPEYYALLASEERMQQEVFQHLSLEQVNNFRVQVLKENIYMLEDILAFRLHQVSISTEGAALKGVKP